MKYEKIGEIGQPTITSHLNEVMELNSDFEQEVYRAFNRYVNCDWGDLEAEDKALNDSAVQEPGSDRILAAYKLSKGKIYIITEWDRSYTTLMFAEDY